MLVRGVSLAEIVQGDLDHFPVNLDRHGCGPVDLVFLEVSGFSGRLVVIALVFIFGGNLVGFLIYGFFGRAIGPVACGKPGGLVVVVAAVFSPPSSSGGGGGGTPGSMPMPAAAGAVICLV
jgi:hypothetical protein